MNKKFMQRAIDLALQNVRRAKGGPFGTVIVRDGRSLAEGVNRVTAANDPTAHAEIVAIRQACQKINDFNLSGCELYTTCEPCPMCLSAIYWARISRVYYAATQRDAAEAGFDDTFIYEELARPLAQRNLTMKPLMDREAKAIFYEWMHSEKKILY